MTFGLFKVLRISNALLNYPNPVISVSIEDFFFQFIFNQERMDAHQTIEKLKYKRWKPLKVEDEVLYLKSKFESDGYWLMVSNLQRVWYRHSNLEKLEQERKVIFHLYRCS
jgi:hypothetical protein